METLSVLDEGRRLFHCSGVYEPAEDTWLTLAVLKQIMPTLKPLTCIDIGTGTGVLAAECNAENIYATDISPCAVLCAKRNLFRLNPLAEVAQCDLASCLRCPTRGPLLVVFNTPYLPAEERVDPCLDYAWSGGAEPALRVLESLAGCVSRLGGCFLLTTLGLWVEDILSTAKKLGLETAIAASERFFFEEIVVVKACSPRR